VRAKYEPTSVYGVKGVGIENSRGGRPAKPTSTIPLTAGKTVGNLDKQHELVLQERAAAGVDLFHPDDAQVRFKDW
jgi:hypothetical protein